MEAIEYGPFLVNGVWVNGPKQLGQSSISTSNGNQALPGIFTGADPALALTALGHAHNLLMEQGPLPWSMRTPLLRAAAERLKSVAAMLAERYAAEQSYSADVARGEIQRNIDVILTWAGQFERFVPHAMIDVEKGEWVMGKVMQPLGPALILGATNYAVNIGLIGYQMLLALLAGCPVIGKSSRYLRGTETILAWCLWQAMRDVKAPEGWFQFLHGEHDVVEALAQDSRLRIAAVTGGEAVTRVLLQARAKNPGLVVMAENGGHNPHVVTKSALCEYHTAMREEMRTTMVARVAQRCTVNNVTIVPNCPELFELLLDPQREFVRSLTPASLISSRAYDNYTSAVERCRRTTGIRVWAESDKTARKSHSEARPVEFLTTATAWIAEQMSNLPEMFGPARIWVLCDSHGEMAKVLQSLPPSLAGSLYATPEELQSDRSVQQLYHELQRRVGRIERNRITAGVPDMRRACAHVGPGFPAGTGHSSTSVDGFASFCFPQCYTYTAGDPEDLLPEPLRRSYAGPRFIDHQLRGGAAREIL